MKQGEVNGCEVQQPLMKVKQHHVEGYNKLKGQSGLIP